MPILSALAANAFKNKKTTAISTALLTSALYIGAEKAFNQSPLDVVHAIEDGTVTAVKATGNTVCKLNEPEQNWYKTFCKNMEP